MDAGQERHLYSTLEVVPDHNLPQVVPESAPEYYKAPDGQEYGAVHSQYYQAKEYSVVNHTRMARPTHLAQQPRTTTSQGNEKAARKKRCGLAPKTFWAVAALGGIIVVAAIIGGAVGGALAHKNGNGQASTSPSNQDSGGQGGNSTSATNTTSTSTTVLNPTSRISAINWTDTDSFSHYAVFSQDTSSSLMVSVWDSQNHTWTATNVSQALAESGNPISVKPGTALAGTVYRSAGLGLPDEPVLCNAGERNRRDLQPGYERQGMGGWRPRKTIAQDRRGQQPDGGRLASLRLWLFPKYIRRVRGLREQPQSSKWHRLELDDYGYLEPRLGLWLDPHTLYHRWWEQWN